MAKHDTDGRKPRTNYLVHGTNSGYCYWKCRCEECVNAYRDYQKSYHEKNKEAKNEKSRKWRSRNPNYENERYAREESFRKKKLAKHKSRKYSKRSNGCNCADFASILLLLELSEYKCFYCNGSHEHLDHFIPLSKGGTNCISNIRPSCSRCNLSKSNKMPEDWGIPDSAFPPVLTCRRLQDVQ